MMRICACGQVFPNRKELRVHIALATDRWPVERCSNTHHDPSDEIDQHNLRWRNVLNRIKGKTHEHN